MRVRVISKTGAWAYTRPADPDPTTGAARSWLPGFHPKGAVLELRVPKTEVGRDGIPKAVYRRDEDGVRRTVFVEPEALAPRIFELAEEDPAVKAAAAKLEAEKAKAKYDALAAEAKEAEDAAKAKAAAEAKKAQDAAKAAEDAAKGQAKDKA